MNFYRKSSFFGFIVFLAFAVSSIIAFSSNTTQALTPFTTTWKTDQVNENDATITIPAVPSLTYNYFIDWGDGLSDSGVTSTIEHTYNTPGTYQVSISGTFPRMFFKDSNDRQKIQSVDAWGSIVWQSMVDAFSGCEYVRIRATDKPNLSQVNSLSGMFRNAKSMNDPIGHWDLGAVSGIVGMFEGATSFNQNLNSWDTSNVQMFAYAFRKASSFNSPINNWDMNNAITTSGMFADATSFNQPLNNWQFAKVNDMSAMFHNAFSFNQDISSWSVSGVTRMESMFRNAIQFEQDISNWNFTGLISANLLFSGSRLSSTHYDRLLTSLAAANVRENVRLDVGTSTFCNAEEARLRLINTKKWNITDGGKDTQGCGTADIRFSRGVAGVVRENDPIGSTVDQLVTLRSSQTAPFTYSFCESSTEDSAFFIIEGDLLKLKQILDFEKPEDQNKDNVYTVCIMSKSALGVPLQKLLTVSVIDIEDAPTTSSSTGVLSSSTGSGQANDSAVLAETSGSNAKVLAASGAAIITGLLVGTLIVLSPLFSFWRAPKTIRTTAKGFSKFK